MVQLTSKVNKSSLRDGLEVLELTVPAVSEGIARQKARASSVIKDMDDPEITDVENIGNSGIPGRPLWLVTIEGLR